MSGIGRRLRKEEDGYALVISVILLFVMMMLLVVGLQAGNSALDQSQRGIEWTRTLTVAESGVNDALSRLSGDRAAVSPCPTSGSTACTGEGGEYQAGANGFLRFQDQFTECCAAAGVGCRSLIVELGQAQEYPPGDGLLFRRELIGKNRLSSFCNRAAHAPRGTITVQSKCVTTPAFPGGKQSMG